MEFDSTSIPDKLPCKVRFTSSDFGHVGLLNRVSPGEYVLLDMGIALEIRDARPIRTARDTGFYWFNFRARTFGDWASFVAPDNDLVCRIAMENPGLVSRDLADLDRENYYRMSFKHRHKPLVEFLAGGPRIGVIYELYAASGQIERVGVYCGTDREGLGGAVMFFDIEKFKMI